MVRENFAQPNEMFQRGLSGIESDGPSRFRSAVDEHDNDRQPLGDVRGVSHTVEEETQDESGSEWFTWAVEDGAAENYRRLGQCLAQCGDLYRNKIDGIGLIEMRRGGNARLIINGKQLAPVIVDRVRIRVMKKGKVVSDGPPSGHLTSMLSSDMFLGQFIPVDLVTKAPFYLNDFTPAQPGFNDGGDGNRVIYLGDEQSTSQSMETLERFLDVMPFASNADRTNFVAAGLTIPLRRLWPGEKPLILITSTRSHSGKGTLTECLRGSIPKADILYQSIDWPMQDQLQKQLKAISDIGVVVIDNVRLDSAGGRNRSIRSAFLESLLTNTEMTLASSGAGEPLRLANQFVTILNSNDGSLSIDLLNRSLPIHLAPTGDVHEQESPIGNPKLEFLPQFGREIDAVFRGMIARWKAEGSPLDNSIRYPMSNWARTIGGILMVNGYTDFLANDRAGTAAVDPVREALAILGAARPGEALRPAEWAELAVAQGLATTLFSVNEQGTPAGRERNIGRTMKRHLSVTFSAQTDTTVYRLRLNGGFRRWTPGKNPYTRYKFEVLSETDRPEDVVRQDRPRT